MGFGDAPSVAVLVAALVVDLGVGEFPRRVHLVVWIGHVTRAAERFLPERGPGRQLVAGTILALTVPAVFAAGSDLLLSSLRPWAFAHLAVSVFLLAPTFALRELGRAALTVRHALARGELDAAREGLKSLCSRDATRLRRDQLVGATIESLAENASDSFVAPIFYYVLFGVPGAVYYRAVNTLDAMVGYHGRYEYLGKACARLDDMLNLIPSRLTAGCLLVAGALSGRNPRRGLAVLLRDGRKTESPNAGQPMAAMAGLLAVRLEKTGQYELGDPTEVLTTQKITDAWYLVALGAGIAFVGALTAVGLRCAAT